MSVYVLDTDEVTFLLRGQLQICERVAAHNPEELAVSIITVEEILTGWYSQIRRAKKDEQLARAYQALQEAVEFLARIRILPFDPSAIRAFRGLQARKLGVKVNDLKIASIVLQNQAIVVTHNVRDFKKVPGMRLEDWSVP